MNEIWKDVERTYPEKDLFQNDASRKCIQMVLYHWCKECGDRDRLDARTSMVR